MENTYTPGPWRLSAGDETAIFTGCGKRISAAYSGGLSGIGIGEAEANARLIAAAPDMIAALQMALIALERSEKERGIRHLETFAVRAAIAKAVQS
jgi:hypothetical protein